MPANNNGKPSDKHLAETELLVQQLCSAANAAVDRYSKLVLVLGASESVSASALEQVAVHRKAAVIKLGEVVSKELLNVPPRNRPVIADEVLSKALCGSGADGLRVVGNIEAMFLPELHLDPLNLLQGASRNQVLIAAWPGASDGRTLLYGRSGHPEFRQYETVDALIVIAALGPRG